MARPTLALSRRILNSALLAGLTLASASNHVARASVQEPATATPAAARKLGTVTAIQGTTVSIAVDKAPQPVTISVPANAPVLQLAPGSTDLKSAQPSTFSSISIGDRVLVSGKAGDGDTFVALRVILIKSADIAQRNAASQQDWQRRGSGGIVTAVEATSGAITISLHAKKIQLDTTSATIFRRYAPGSVKFEDATLGKIADLHTGDQLRVRGEKSEDGSTIKAEEIVFGSFRNIAGTIATLNPGSTTITMKDLATKKDVVVHLTPTSDLRMLPPDVAARFAARSKPAEGVQTNGRTRPSGAAATPGAPTTAAPAAVSTDGAEQQGRGPGRGANGGAGGDLSQMIPHLPAAAVTDLKPGEALMIVASDSADGTLTAITVLSGVEPILAATPSGGQPITLSPINAGAMEAGSGVQ